MDRPAVAVDSIDGSVDTAIDESALPVSDPGPDLSAVIDCEAVYYDDEDHRDPFGSTDSQSDRWETFVLE